MLQTFNRQTQTQLVELETIECVGCPFSHEVEHARWECTAPSTVAPLSLDLTARVVPTGCPLRRGPVMVRLAPEAKR